MTSTFSFLLLSLITACIVQAQEKICAHDVFDVISLKKQPEWTFRVGDAKWCVGGEANIEAECQATFSICGPLAANSCGSSNDTGFCQKVTSGNIVSTFDTGKATVIVNEEEGTDGFQFAYRNGTNTSTCNETTSTLLFFQCDENAQWNIYDNNVTRFVDSFLPNPTDPCLFIAVLNYSGACVTQKPIFPKLCQLDGYDLQTLSESIAWVAQEPSASCYGLSVPEKTCELLFSFCKELPSGQCYKSAFCQQGTEQQYSFGEFNEHVKTNENEGSTGFTMTYINGTKTTTCPAGFFSTLVFTCDPNAVWPIDPTTDTVNITQYVTAAEPFFTDCEYIVRFNYSGACFSGTVPTLPISNGSKPSPVGWILMGIFFGVAIMYLAVGIIIQVIRGKKGLEIVPNSDFWRAVIVYVLEGCKITVDFVTCSSLRNNKSMTFSSKKTDYESL